MNESNINIVKTVKAVTIQNRSDSSPCIYIHSEFLSLMGVGECERLEEWVVVHYPVPDQEISWILHWLLTILHYAC